MDNVTSKIEDRIRQIMKSENFTQQEFAKVLQISPSTLSSIFNGRTRPTNNHTMAIHHAFPNLNINWLLFGEGQMYDTPSVGGSSSTSSDASSVSPQSAPASPSATSLFPGSQENRPVSGGTTLMNSSESPTLDFRQLSREPLIQARQETVKKVDIKQRKIKEIRVFFDDGTYESFSPQKSWEYRLSLTILPDGLISFYERKLTSDVVL